jgi:signal transduction histidine kinase/ActR/RegA family two-component response regulator
MSSADWQNTPLTLPLLLSGLLCGWVAHVGWRRRAVPGAVPFVVLTAALAGWALVNLVEKSLVHHEFRRSVAVFLYLFIVTVPGAWFLFASRFSRQEHWLPRRLVPLLFLEPALIVALAFTNPYHGLIHAATEMKTDGEYAVMAITHGPFFYVNVAYSYLLFAAGAVLLVVFVARQPDRSVGRVAIVLGSTLVPLLGNLAYVVGWQPRRLTDLTPVYFAVSGLAAAWLLFRFRVFDVLPIARDLVLDCLGDAVFVLDSRFRILDANLAARALMPGLRRVQKRPLADALPELSRYLPAQPAIGWTASGIRLGSAGAERFWDMHVLPLIDQGATLGTLVRLTDVTERRCLEEELLRQAQQLAAADRRKDEFLAMLGHELRNPLAPLRNAVLLLRRLGPPDPHVQRCTELIERQVKAMTRLVDDLLDVSRITSGKIKLQRETVDLAAVVARGVEMTRPLIDARGQVLKVTLGPEPVRLEADPTRLAQAIGNLLNNAAKYTQEGGQIGLTAGREGGDVVVRVRDDGVGIAAELLPHVFDLFTQGDHSLARSGGGLGIGLTLVKKLVELHGGSVEAHSDGADQGSEFVVRLPALSLAPGPVSFDSMDQGQRTKDKGPSRRVLVVDDNVDAAESLAILLHMEGHEVRTTYDGPAALGAAETFRPEIVLLDIGLPKMDGYEVARRLRRAPGLEKVVLVALTGYGQEEDRRSSREATIDHHLVKPVDPEALWTLLADPESLADKCCSA